MVLSHLNDVIGEVMDVKRCYQVNLMPRFDI